MSPVDTRRVRWSLVRDAQGRDLFVPWHPWSRTAYVLPDPLRRGALEQRVRRQAAWLLTIGFGGMLLVYLTLGPAPALAIIVAVVVYHAAWGWLASRGLERTRYEPPPR